MTTIRTLFASLSIALSVAACAIDEGAIEGISSAAVTADGGVEAGQQVCWSSASCPGSFTCEDYDCDGVRHCSIGGQGGPTNCCVDDASCGAGYSCAAGRCTPVSTSSGGASSGSDGGASRDGGSYCDPWTDPRFQLLLGQVSRACGAVQLDQCSTAITVVNMIVNAGCSIPSAVQTCNDAAESAADPSRERDDQHLDCVDCCNALLAAAGGSDPLYQCVRACDIAFYGH